MLRHQNKDGTWCLSLTLSGNQTHDPTTVPAGACGSVISIGDLQNEHHALGLLRAKQKGKHYMTTKQEKRAMARKAERMIRLAYQLEHEASGMRQITDKYASWINSIASDCGKCGRSMLDAVEKTAA